MPIDPIAALASHKAAMGQQHPRRNRGCSFVTVHIYELGVAATAAGESAGGSIQTVGPYYLIHLPTKRVALEDEDPGHAPLFGEGAVASEQDPVLFQGSPDELSVGDICLVGSVETEKAKPTHQSTEHRIDDESRLSAGIGLPDLRRQANSLPTGAIKSTPELKETHVVLPFARWAEHRHTSHREG